VIVKKALSILSLFLLQLPMLVAAQEREAANAPVETVSMGAVVTFAVIFIGMIVGFFIYLFMKKEEPAKK
jgi:ABC-type methionine transport system permease subunit